MFLSIKKAMRDDMFENWFHNNIEIDKEIEAFLIELIDENRLFMDSYNVIGIVGRDTGMPYDSVYCRNIFC